MFAKSPTSRYTGQHRNISVFTFDICDESSEIRVTAYDQQCENFQHRITVGRVYRIIHGDVIFAKQKYNALKHPFSIKIIKQTTIEEAEDDPSDNIPLIHFQLVKISSLGKLIAGNYTGRYINCHLQSRSIKSEPQTFV